MYNFSDVINPAIKNRMTTQEESARKASMSRSKFLRLISGEQHMSPDDALAISKAISADLFTMLYCKLGCSIGKVYCYKPLNNVDSSPIASISILLSKVREIEEAMPEVMPVFKQRKKYGTLSQSQKKQIDLFLLKLADLDNNIDKIWEEAIHMGISISDIVLAENKKAQEKGYYDSKLVNVAI